jgi:hypothetical protein
MNSTPETRASLLIRVRDRDDQLAEDEFVEIYRPVVLRMARQKGMQDAHYVLPIPRDSFAAEPVPTEMVPPVPE